MYAKKRSNAASRNDQKTDPSAAADFSASAFLRESHATAPAPMSPALLEKFEPGFGANFENIRISRGYIPPEAGVKAVARGTDILLDRNAGNDVLGHAVGGDTVVTPDAEERVQRVQIAAAHLHAGGRRGHVRPDVRQARDLQQALHGAVLAVLAVEHGEDDVQPLAHDAVVFKTQKPLAVHGRERRAAVARVILPGAGRQHEPVPEH